MQCPACREEILDGASKCRYCHSVLPPPLQPAPAFIPIARVFAWTLPWMAVMLAGVIFASSSLFDSRVLPYDGYIGIRLFGIAMMLALLVSGIMVAARFVGPASGSTPWYTSGFLVALVLFWALFPPTWFFVEYSFFEHGRIPIPRDNRLCKDLKDANDCLPTYLTHLKSYADLASKIWAAVGVSLAVIISAARK